MLRIGGKFVVAVDGKSFGEEVGWVEDGAEVQRYAPIKIIGIKIIVPIKSEKSLRLMVHISKTLTKSLR